jgi:hypothetical protein
MNTVLIRRLRDWPSSLAPNIKEDLRETREMMDNKILRRFPVNINENSVC